MKLNHSAIFVLFEPISGSHDLLFHKATVTLLIATEILRQHDIQIRSANELHRFLAQTGDNS